MLVRFRKPETLVEAIQRGWIASATLNLPVRALHDADGIWLHLDARLPLRTRHALTELGIDWDPPKPPAKLIAYPDWARMLPLMPVRGHEMPVGVECLLEIPSILELIQVSCELSRLGRADHHLRYPTVEGEPGYLRVHSPPQLTIERWSSGHDCGGIAAYWKSGDRAWIQWGWRHPTPERIPGSPLGSWLLRNSMPWREFDERDFLPARQRGFLALPTQATNWNDGSAPVRYSNPLRLLRQRNHSGAASAWWIDAPAEANLLDFLRELDERRLNQLQFMRLRCGDQIAILLKATGRDEIPVMLLPAMGFQPLLKLASLQIADGYRISPPIARDRLRVALGCESPNSESSESDVWLQPQPQSSDGDAAPGGMIRNAMPPRRFQSLADSVAHVVSEPTRHLQAVRVGDAFPMLPFDIVEEATAPKKKSKQDRTVVLQWPTQTPVKDVVSHKKAQTRPEPPPLEPIVFDVNLTDEQIVLQLRNLRSQLDALAENAPDAAPESASVSIWQQMAELYHRLNQPNEAAICWSQAMWLAPEWSGAIVSRWDEYERQTVIPARRSANPKASRIDQYRKHCLEILLPLTKMHPEPSRERRQTIVESLELGEETLPVRLVWLTWLEITQQSGGDVLALTRARDRILLQLHEFGLIIDRDLPSVLRGDVALETGMDAGRLNLLLEHARRWTGDQSSAILGPSKMRDGAFVALIFAYGYARQGLRENAMALLRSGADRLAKQSVPRRWLLEAYTDRTQQVLDGKRPRSPLNEDLIRLRMKLPSPDARTVNFLMQRSQLLDPSAVNDPLQVFEVDPNSALAKELGRFRELVSPAVLERRFPELLAQYTTKSERFLILREAISKAFQVRDSFAQLVFSQIRTVRQQFGYFIDLPAMLQWGTLLETALALAGHHERPAEIRTVMQHYQEMLKPLQGERAAWFIGGMNPGIFRRLAKLGEATLAAEFHNDLATKVILTEGIQATLKQPGANRPVLLQAMLRLAGGWFYFGNDRLAQEVIEAARREVYSTDYRPATQLDLACGLVECLANAPANQAMREYITLLTRLRMSEVGPSADYSYVVIGILERMILAVSSEDFRIDQSVRRRLDEEEYRIRQRIHADVRVAMQSAGL
ncbi:hypothetical protein [Tuwongella immobilis]|uniref:FtsH ternary system domain-containing protein n=1 Tax=Tuwongella immobilis TaxID=692036 RepID=A0A6C2YMA2_9BACT|nr:hypothetical protein [Tuwongella immobilis]VIP02720.1 Uncharacterized protein OS=Myxococcus stipitatus (strain DSM 14675 / JCM 12634 / Mx s8) GN=MYSTI_03368 PE=4 SV=1 [Tuwongella immobilis]VTS02251.1 Uncharacterized protein OS=Myxococcus stipitatus (strain DSM 14675 / JCM 12634 / Mx s8) GN=MYSTI_03368 PE=4 SV=1 [Tuwongella immobilis]